jgi:hypothetical protein
MNEQAPFEAYDEGECQHSYAGYSSQVTPTWETLLKVQFGHDITPVFGRLNHMRSSQTGGLTKLFAFEPKQTGTSASEGTQRSSRRPVAIALFTSTTPLMVSRAIGISLER